MFARLLVGMVISPLYGLLALLAAMPMFLVGLIVIVVLGSAIEFDPIGGGATAMVTIGLWVLALAVLGIALQIAFTVQTARYAGSFTKLMPITEQPPYMTAFWRGVLIIVVMNIFFGMLLLLIGAFTTDLWSSLGFNAFSREELAEGMERLAIALEQNQRSPEVIALLRMMFVSLVFNWLYTLVLAVILVPRVCGIGGESGYAWKTRFLLFRVFIAMPICALICALLAEGFMMALEAGLGDFTLIARTQVSYSLQAFFFMGVVFGMEALTLKAARETAYEVYTAHQAQNHDGSPDDFRELRMRRTGG